MWLGENPAATDPLPRRPARIGLAFALATLLGFSTSASAQIGPRALGGRWTVALTVDSAATPSPRTASISGTMVLVAVERAERPTFRGSYQIPFRTIGLSPDAAPVLAWIGRADSIRVVLNPDVSHGHAELTGTWRGGQIQGRWRWIGRPGGEGSFTLRPMR